MPSSSESAIDFDCLKRSFLVVMELMPKQQLTKCGYASTVWWALCVITVVLGCSVGVIGLWIAATKQDATGLYLSILTPFLLAAAGIFGILRSRAKHSKEKTIKVRWRTWNPMGLLLCWMFNKQCPQPLWRWGWSAHCLYGAHKFFCPDLHENAY